MDSLEQLIVFLRTRLTHRRFRVTIKENLTFGLPRAGSQWGGNIMQILVVGMGLIGASICKSIKAVTEHTVYGCDVRQDVLEQALEDGSIDGTGTMEDGAYDMIIVCLHQRIAISLIQKALPRIKAGTILVDACGLKGKMVSAGYADGSEKCSFRVRSRERLQ